MSNSFQRSTAGTTAGEAIDIKKTRRRIEDALRKTATRDEILHIAKLLRIKVEPVKREECSRCGQIDETCGMKVSRSVMGLSPHRDCGSGCAAGTSGFLQGDIQRLAIKGIA